MIQVNFIQIIRQKIFRNMKLEIESALAQSAKEIINFRTAFRRGSSIDFSTQPHWRRAILADRLIRDNPWPVKSRALTFRRADYLLPDEKDETN